MGKTYTVKAGEIEQCWHLVDGEDQVLGRLATRIASLLRGKHKPTFTPHLDMGDHVVVINADKVRLTGNKLDQKIHYRHDNRPGHLKETRYRIIMANRPEQAVLLAVKGMLPHNKLGRELLTKLKVYRGAEHPHQAQLR